VLPVCSKSGRGAISAISIVRIHGRLVRKASPLRIVRRKLIWIPRRRRQMRNGLSVVAVAQRRSASPEQLAITIAKRWSCAPAHITVLPSRDTP